jgi:hypothetical protein
MPDRRVTVFFYGLFMDAQVLRAKGFSPVAARPACVQAAALRIGRRATLIPDVSSRVYGFVMELSHAELDQLYSEPSVRDYRPEAVLAHANDGSAVPALCFNLPTPPPPGESNADYASKLRDLAKRLQLPAEYVASIG